MLKRTFDLSFCLLFIVIFSFIMILIALLIRLTSKGPSLYWSERVGRDNRIFFMPKFRTMRINAPVLATHKMNNPNKFITPIGGFLRRYSLDELPQLFSIFKGEMSFVGPRPALFNQDDLIALRSEYGIDKLLPGLTGLAQINGRDNIAIPEKVLLDFEYLQKHSFFVDLEILWQTLLKVLKREGVSH